MTIVELASVKDKLTNAANALNMAEAGRVWLPANDPTFPLEDVEAQLIRFTGDPSQDGHDDVVDTLSMAANRVIARGENKPMKILGVVREGF
jgi:phage terminase large subunit-like protein